VPPPPLPTSRLGQSLLLGFAHIWRTLTLGWGGPCQPSNDIDLALSAGDIIKVSYCLITTSVFY
jgi:hypothetical protein